MNADIASSWLTSKLFRVLLLIVGVLLFVMYGLVFIVVGVNLPGSWPGLVFVMTNNSAAGLELLGFNIPAPIMSLGVLLHLALRSEPLRTRTIDPEIAGL